MDMLRHVNFSSCNFILFFYKKRKKKMDVYGEKNLKVEFLACVF